MGKLTASELRYLLAIDEGKEKIRMVDISKKTGISKPSVSQAVSKLEKRGLVVKGGLLSLTEDGKAILTEYKDIVLWLQNHLSIHCGVSENIAYQDALGVACTFSDVSRAGIVKFMREMCEKQKKGGV